MNYQYLLHQLYEEESQKDESVVIENPYDKDSTSEATGNSNYDVSVLNTSVPAKEIVQMVQNALENDRINHKPQGIRILFYGVSGGGKTNLAHYIANSTGKEIISAVRSPSMTGFGAVVLPRMNAHTRRAKAIHPIAM